MYKMEHIHRMSAEEKKLLRRSWFVMAPQINELGREIFDMIFSQAPDTKTLFPFMNLKKPPSEKVLKEIEFHGLRFMQIIETTIKALDNPQAMQSLEQILDNLGRRHGKLTENRGFSPHHWSVFIECCLYHFRMMMAEDSYFNSVVVIDRAMILWRILLKSIIKRMKIGLQQDLKNRQANRDYAANEFDGLTISSTDSGDRRRPQLCKSSSLLNSSTDSAC
ncbi:Globin [Aphelenchoides fujianensis]|nr:Globin [Aphelenchoides fujianensis]